jgi:hypothetical protein
MFQFHFNFTKTPLKLIPRHGDAKLPRRHCPGSTSRAFMSAMWLKEYPRWMKHLTEMGVLQRTFFNDVLLVESKCGAMNYN